MELLRDLTSGFFTATIPMIDSANRPAFKSGLATALQASGVSCYIGTTLMSPISIAVTELGTTGLYNISFQVSTTLTTPLNSATLYTMIISATGADKQVILFQNRPASNASTVDVNVVKVDGIALTSGHTAGQIPADVRTSIVVDSNTTKILGTAVSNTAVAGFMPSDVRRVDSVVLTAGHTAGKFPADVGAVTVSGTVNANVLTIESTDATDYYGALDTGIHTHLNSVQTQLSGLEVETAAASRYTNIMNNIDACESSINSNIDTGVQVSGTVSANVLSVEGTDATNYFENISTGMHTHISQVQTQMNGLETDASAHTRFNSIVTDINQNEGKIDSILSAVNGVLTTDTTIDGVTVSKMFTALCSMATGNASITEVSGGRREISYKKNDGTTEAFALETSSAGIVRLRW